MAIKLKPTGNNKSKRSDVLLALEDDEMGNIDLVAYEDGDDFPIVLLSINTRDGSITAVGSADNEPLKDNGFKFDKEGRVKITKG